MGRRYSPANLPARRFFTKVAAIGIIGIGAVAALITLSACPAVSQTLNERLARRSGATPSENGQKDRMLLDASEMAFDRNKDTVEARGDVQIFYQGRALQADKVIYDRKSRRVFAEGRVKITERDGTISYADKAELTDDFKTGFVDSLRVETPDKTYFSSPRTERNEGETTVFNSGTYTACESCKENPDKPPLWRVRAKRIIHQNTEQMVYFEDASLELWGMPIAWLPFFSMPDPSVTRKSGFLAPSYIARTNLGAGVTIPYFWAIAPNMDLSIAPTLLSKQGVLGDVEWRHRLVNGSYSIRAIGIFQAEPDVFLKAPFGPGSRQMRGSVESKGEFLINDKWKTGWNLKLLSDRYFQQDYRTPSAQLSQNYFRESTSSVYFTGQGNSGYFDLRGFYFQGLSRADIQGQQPVVAPVLDYNKTVSLPPSLTWGIGGQVTLDFNFTNISRELASFEAIGGRRLDRAYGLFDVCENAKGAPTYSRTQCLLRGMAGNYSRATLNIEWKRKFIDPIGQVWTPFAFAHVNGAWINVADGGNRTFNNPDCKIPVEEGLFKGQCASQISNNDQATFFNNGNKTFFGQVTPGAGIEYRYPFLASDSLAWHVFEPIAQIIVRPNTSRNVTKVNEDAQSLVFDETNLFDYSKYSGYDRFEGGTRANYGFQYTATFKQGGYLSAMIGQSMQLAGNNSYASPDAANVGLNSGLDKKRSDVVARLAFAPNSMFSFIAKSRIDPDTREIKRVDLMANMNFGSFETSLQYARYSAQPLIGYDQRREGLAAGAKYKITENIALNGNVIFDLSRHLYNGAATTGPAIRPAPLFSIAGLGLGATYTDDCTTLGVQYTSVLQANGAGQSVRNQTLLFSLQLRTVGDTKVRSSLGETPVQDGLGGGVIR